MSHRTSLVSKRRKLANMAGTIAIILSGAGLAANSLAIAVGGGTGSGGGAAGGGAGTGGGGGAASTSGSTGGGTGASGGSRAGVYGPARNAARSGDSNPAPQNSPDDGGVGSQDSFGQGSAPRDLDGSREDVDPIDGRRDNVNRRDPVDGGLDSQINPQVNQPRGGAFPTDTFRSSDADRDGRLSEEEFEEFRRRNDGPRVDGAPNFSELDRNNDNELTLEDVNRPPRQPAQE